MSFSAGRTYPRTAVVLAFLALSAAAQLQTVVDLHPAPAGSPAIRHNTGPTGG